MKFGSGGWNQFTLDDSPSLPLLDPLSADLRSKSVAAEARAEATRMAWHLNRRAAQFQALARRKAERETVENYTQTPFRAAQGLVFGVDVMTSRFDALNRKMRDATRVKADRVLDKFARFMRANMMRVADLIDKVDTSCDGVVDLGELAAAVKMVRLDMAEDELKVLFEFLDASGDGTIDAAELEGAMRDYRRLMFERKR